jgi:gamma-butyrobetaine dioxygenase
MNAPTRTLPRIVDAVSNGTRLQIDWSDGSTDAISGLWLRDNCPSTGDRNSAIRSFSLEEMPDDLAIGSVNVRDGQKLEIVWRPDGHLSCFQAEWLSENLPGRRKRYRAETWDATLQARLSWIDHGQIDEGNSGHLALLQSLAARGFALIHNIPDDETATEALLNRAGFIQENDFGRIFNIISEPEVWELSQSDLALHVHTDDPYRHTPPGISLLHCVEASSEGGGVSVLVDGFAVAEQFRDLDPGGFDLLSSIPVSFIRYREDPVPQGDDVYLLAEAPIISLDSTGAVTGFRYHERSMAPLDLPPEMMERFYPALIAFTRLLYADAFKVTHRLSGGEAIMFDNQRVLHGRTAFDGTAGRRHMRLAQTSRDQFHSKLRLLRSRHGADGVNDPLSAGARF